MPAEPPGEPPADTRADAAGGFDVHRAYRRSPTVAMRAEPFGGLAYNFTTRRLTYLASAQLVTVVESLERYGSAAATLAAAGVPPQSRAAVERSLAALFDLGVLDAR